MASRESKPFCVEKVGVSDSLLPCNSNNSNKNVFYPIHDAGGNGGGIVPRRIPPLVEGILPISQSSFSLVGSGVELSRCGSYFTVGCLNVEDHKGMNLDGVNMDGKAYLERVKYSCHRPLCPTCWTDWANREVKKAVKRLDSYRLKGRSVKPVHVIVSVPTVDFGLSLEIMRKKAYSVLKRVHCHGGVVIYHPFRQKKDKSWYFSPHFHVVGYGWIMDIRANYVHSGYVVKNVGIRKTLAGTLFYQLSHCGVDGKHHTVTWFGSLSYNRLHVRYECEDRLCPICRGKLYRLIWVGNGEMPLIDVEGVGFFDDPENWVRWRFDVG